MTNEQVFRRFAEEAVAGGKLEVIDEVWHPDGVMFHPDYPEPLRGPAAIREHVQGSRAALSDLRVRVDEVIPAGDRLTVRVNWTGTNTGEVMGQPATGRTVTFDVAVILRFAEGRIIEARPYADNLALLVQLGLVEVPQPA
jgi:predicted ester cyclase